MLHPGVNGDEDDDEIKLNDETYSVLWELAELNLFTLYNKYTAFNVVFLPLKMIEIILVLK